MEQELEIMTDTPKGIELEIGEEVRLISRCHWYVFRNAFLLSFFLPFVLLAVTFFVDYVSLPAWLPRLLIQLVLLISFFCFTLGAVLFFWRLFLWLRTYYIVTNRRLILVTQRGLFSKDRRETSLDMIQDVKAEVSGLQAALYGFGDVVVQISSQESKLIFEKVGGPYYVQRVIMREAHLQGGDGNQ
ncbi:PH domain-containing protein [Patescibacteria group bacterium]|nr:PH domain-containing protein [Patescibacteria group bacterium]